MRVCQPGRTAGSMEAPGGLFPQHAMDEGDGG